MFHQGVTVTILRRESLWPFSVPRDHCQGQAHHSTVVSCSGCSAGVMGFAQPFVGPGIHGVREVVCVPEAAGKITKCWLHKVFYITPACFLEHI